MKKLFLIFALLITSVAFCTLDLEDINLKAKEKIRVPEKFFNSVDAVDEIQVIHLQGEGTLTNGLSTITGTTNYSPFWNEFEYAVTNGMRFQLMKIAITRLEYGAGGNGDLVVNLQLNDAILASFSLDASEFYQEWTYPICSNINADATAASTFTPLSNIDAFSNNSGVHGLVSNDVIQITYGTNLPTGLALQTNYWAKQFPSATNFVVGASEDGDTNVITVGGLGVMRWQPVNLINFKGKLWNSAGTNNRVIVDVWGIVYTPE